MVPSIRFSWKQLALDYGMIFVLLALCAGFSMATIAVNHPDDENAARTLARRVLTEFGNDVPVLLATRSSTTDTAFANAFEVALTAGGGKLLTKTSGTPTEARQTLEGLIENNTLPKVIAGTQAANNAVFSSASLSKLHPDLGAVPFLHPPGETWPVFLTRGNLLNVTTQIVVIAIIAIGMTMIIITAGIDLSVGSLVALSACVAAAIIYQVAGTESTSDVGGATVLLACGAAIGLCGLIGLFSGVMLTAFHIPPFIVTLAIMLIARGLAYKATGGQALGSLPDTFAWIGHSNLAGIPTSVLLMVACYVAAFVLMNYSRLGRYIYAVGGNLEAARLSGVPVNRVLITVYTLGGLLAGLGGIIMGSELKTGDPKTGQLYELYVIAAVVVGGTSLAGGQGRILGTLIGAFIIGVVRNGMNLCNVKPFNQYIVFGAIILLAVLLEKLKSRIWKQSRA